MAPDSDGECGTRLRVALGIVLGGAVLLAAAQPSHANCYRLLKPNGWQYETVCSGGGGGGGGGGSGGGNAAGVAAGLGAGAAILGILGEMANQEQQNQAAANAEAARAEAARQAYCQQNWRQASQRISIGNDLVNHLRPGEAIPHYQTAAELLSRCGDSRNVDIARRNLAEAQRQYAAVKPDNRVNDASARYGGNNPYASSSNPFEQKSAGPAADAGPRIAASDLIGSTRQKCRASESDRARWKTCIETQAGRAIMEADPGIKAACGIETNADARNKCALQAYAKQVAAQNARTAGNDNCYYDKNYRNCVPAGGGTAGTGKTEAKTSLRDELKKKLAEEKRLKGDTTPVTEAEVTKALAEQPTSKNVETASNVPASQLDRDDPLLLYLASESRSGSVQSGIVARNSGQLGQPGSVPDASQSYKDRFGIDANPQANEPSIFDQVSGQYRNQQLRGNVGR